jgi:4-amino-4-deoxy-L-arabinose transferase-like glycosyltransferase
VEADERRDFARAVWWTLGFTALRTACAVLVPLFTVEAYYWLWSRALAPGYADHPPMVALLIRAGTSVLGDSALGLRLGGLLAGGIGSLAFFAFCRRVAGPRSALVALVALNVSPCFGELPVIATPDLPLGVFWILALLAFWHAYRGESAGRWLLAGLATGLAVMSKYNGVLLLPAYLLFLLLTPRGRGLLARPGPWLAILVVAVVVAPNVLWNVQHGGRTLATPAGHMDESFSALRLPAYLGECAVIVTPVFFVAWAWALLARRRRATLLADEGLLFCACASVVPFVAFAAVSFKADIHLQWIAPGFLSALPIAVHVLQDAGATGRRWLLGGLVFSAVFVVGLLVLAPVLLGLQWVAGADAPKALQRLSRELRGQPELAARLGDEIARHGPHLLLMSSDYHEASLMTWLVDGAAPAMPLQRDHSKQFLFWYGPQDYVGWDAICVDVDPEGKPPPFAKAFDSLEELPPVVAQVRGREARRIAVWLGHRFKGQLD